MRINPLTWFRSKTVAEPVRTVVREIKGRFEAEDNDNPYHWRYAVATSPNSVANRYARAKLRNKARFESNNNPHLDATVETYAGDFIGSTGPRLQLTFEDPTYQDAARLVEQAFARWACAANLTEHLLTLVKSEPVDGDSFLQLVGNPGIQDPVQLGIIGIEAEQVCNPQAASNLEGALRDGPILDQYGNIVAWTILKTHPLEGLYSTFDYNIVPDESVCHWFRPKRAGQVRGTSRFASVLETCGTARRFSKALLDKAEQNATIAAVMEVDAPMTDDGTPQGMKLMEELPLPNNALLTVPKDSNVKAFEASKLDTKHDEFMNSQFATMGRPVLAARHLVTGDASSYNFSSCKIGQLPYQSAIWRERSRLAQRVLNKILKLWWAFAFQAGVIPEGFPAYSEWQVDWHYDAFPSLYPLDDANAIAMRLKLGLTTLAEECAAEGKDWREVAKQRAAEREYYQSLGLNPDVDTQPNTATDVTASLPKSKIGYEHEEDTKLEHVR